MLFFLSELILKYELILLEIISKAVYDYVPQFLKNHIDRFLVVSAKVRHEIDNQKWNSWTDYIKKPWLIIDFLIQLIILLVILLFIILASISFFINSHLDPLEGYDVGLFVFELTGHYPNTVFLM